MLDTRKNSILIASIGVIISLVAIVVAVCFLVNNNQADAADSPVLPSATENGITFQVLGAEKGDCNQLVVNPTQEVVPGIEVDSSKGEVLVANFYLTTRKGLEYLPDYYNVSFAVGSELAKKVAGRDARIYILHHDGEREVKYLRFNDAGVCSFKLNKLSIFSVVTSFNDIGDSGKNTSAVSPKTGY